MNKQTKNTHSAPSATSRLTLSASGRDPDHRTKYGYDDDAQLESSLGFLYGGSPVAEEQLAFGYDPGWNMTNRTVSSAPVIYTVNDLNQVTSDGVNTYTYDENGNRTDKNGSISYGYDDENRLTEVADVAGHTFRSTFTYDGLGRMRVRKEYTWSGSETEVAKSGMTLSGSGTCCGWEYAYAKNGLTADPGWHNISYSGTTEFLRVDLGSTKNVGHVAYEPRAMASHTVDGSWNGAYRLYAIYVTDDSSGNPDNWGSPVATGEWYWPNLQERRDVYFTAKSGRYVYFRRITAWGWYADQGYPGYASANEIWVYEQSGTWNLASETRYIYDGKRVIQERDGSNVPTVAYTRGKDLSGTLEGAGGIGGLLARSHGYSAGSWSTHSFYHADGNGNVTYMVNSAQAIVASYKYDPYGRTISSSGTLAAANVYRFSSKEFHVNSGLYYYLHRLYDPNTQRWLNRDPIEEEGGLNLYGFIGNRPQNLVDTDGLAWWPPSQWPIRVGPPPPPSITPCTNPQDIAACWNICFLQNKTFGSCNIVKTTKKLPFRLWVQTTFLSCLCGNKPACPFFGSMWTMR